MPGSSTPSPAAPPRLESGPRSPAYRLVEGWHLRQWLVRGSLPLALLCTNGAGAWHVAALPRFDAPLGWLGLPAGATAAVSAAGGLLVATSASLRVLSKGVLVRKTTLTTGGVYRLVRHPFYLATILGSIGVLGLAGPLGAMAAIPWFVAALPVFLVTVAGEEDGLATLYPERWSRYAAAVPGLIPVPGRFGHPPPQNGPAGSVSWANLRSEREPPRLLRFLGGALLVVAAGLGGALGASLAGVGVAMFLLSHAVPGLQPLPRSR